ncbi:Uma2 family endonuclease [Limnoraphis robusta Tam1]|uniref:Uma2 family endonuclease n=1 Tax=Limnoraphis robusta CCNP1315 TaxID=3110306 RepID=A0ABU5U0B5_9CYAN|nr:Uma2 family endonuclease [Limnoraphis robusta]MEA5497667.1 Uma2 family endonuclease [Limnoraphis robusta BA-68 BA1]MEA5520495.1 Uma2 family endonuclease [Limnoraphis robusta CCNP1315]MEA5537659.1 Uma2 family endonuclease [Limnoraphis robusta Tam1]MEA5547008.1 Uma2 family endonuclease [Limnoraphis robusta CCNP1324]
MVNVTVNFNSIIQFTDEQFYQLCRDNPDVKFERNAKGEIIILSATVGITGNLNSEIAADFAIWNRQTKLGVCFDSSTCFKLSNSAQRSPDVAWIKQERWDALTPEQKEKFPPIAPDFVLELMSPSDRLEDLREKMQEYIENGVRLGWLINRQDRQVEIYRPEKAVEVLNAPEALSGEDILPGFVLNLKAILSSSS